MFQEVSVYLSQANLAMDVDIFTYWKQAPFINLTLMARKYLCTPPSSIELERVFLALVDVYNDKCHRLSEEHAHQQLFGLHLSKRQQ